MGRIGWGETLQEVVPLTTARPCVPDAEEITRAGAALEYQAPQAAIVWAAARFGPRVALASSFGLEDVALIDMMHRTAPGMRVFYLDTDLMFPETYRTRDRIRERYGIEPLAYRSMLDVAAQAAEEGERLWEREPGRCCRLRKVEPLRRALAGMDAWVTGLRRDQSPTRAGIRVVEWDEVNALVKVNPLARWSLDAVWAYVRAHDVPFNPMHEHGFLSIGCWPCTRAVRPGEDPRAGRWPGQARTECGLHVAADGNGSAPDEAAADGVRMAAGGHPVE